MNKHHLLLISIGPVQSFIAQSRKLRDLRSGSRLLSEITQEICKAFKNAGGDVIVPGNINALGLPNRMLGTISGESPEQVVEIARALEAAARKFWRKQADLVLQDEKLDQLPGGAEDWLARYDEQIDQLLEVYWALESYSGDEGYKSAYEAIESRLGAVKNARVFAQIGNQFGSDETSRKDALTGERDALMFGAGKSNTKSGWPATTDSSLPRRLHNRGALVGPNEGLSAVSAVKRLRKFDFGKEYFSTADVALLGLNKKLGSENPKELQDYVDELRFTAGEGSDGQLAFQENLTENYFQKQGLDTSRLKALQNKHEDLRRRLSAGGLRQTPYYALLSFDGDNVGQWLSGKKLKSSDGKTLREFHTFIGQKLADFATEAKMIVDESGNGLTVYAGGDDYLGLLTLDAIFPVLGRLRTAFQEQVSKPIQEEYKVAEEFTFSAGLVIAHYKRPLGDTVVLAHEAEKTAKAGRNGKRNALCIRVVKRSGEQQEVVLPWGRLERRSDGEMGYASLHALQNLVAGLQHHNSRTWLTESGRTVAALFGKGKITPGHRDMLEAEMMRLLDRSGDFGRGNTGDFGRSTKQGLRYLIEKSDGSYGARNLVHALQLVDFLKRHVNDLPTIVLATTDETPLELAA